MKPQTAKQPVLENVKLPEYSNTDCDIRKNFDAEKKYTNEG